jgi:hypothetical protein
VLAVEYLDSGDRHAVIDGVWCVFEIDFSGTAQAPCLAARVRLIASVTTTSRPVMQSKDMPRFLGVLKRQHTAPNIRPDLDRFGAQRHMSSNSCFLEEKKNCMDDREEEDVIARKEVLCTLLD